MNRLPEARRRLIELLWGDYLRDCPVSTPALAALRNAGLPIVLDHLAILDLPSLTSGMETMVSLLSPLGFVKGGYGILEDKDNQFTWMREEDTEGAPAHLVLPQVVVTDFIVDRLSPRMRRLVAGLAKNIPPAPLARIQELANEARAGDRRAAQQVADLAHEYLTRTNAPLPDAEDFRYALDENELLAWTLIHGKKVNHFGLAVHLMRGAGSLEKLMSSVIVPSGVIINTAGGSVIKGTAQEGIEQSAVLSPNESFALEKQSFSIPGPFLELVWRHQTASDPALWSSYFNEFVPQNATRVAESLYRPGLVARKRRVLAKPRRAKKTGRVQRTLPVRVSR